MKILQSLSSRATRDELATALRGGALAILRTDTLYGMVARALDKGAVERMYMVKSRDAGKPPIVLVSDLDQIFSTVQGAQRTVLDEVWPGKTSVVLSADSGPDWLTRGGDSIAYRLPAEPNLRALIEHTGPLIAPSANPQGEVPAATIDQAIAYFGERVEYYVDDGEVLDQTPSRLLRLLPDGTTERLR